MYFDENGKTNKPTWVRLNVQELVDFYEIEDANDVLALIEDDPEYLSRMGIVLMNLVLYSKDRTTPLIEIKDRETKSLFRILKHGVDASYVRYEANIENGRKGGRPKKVADE